MKPFVRVLGFATLSIVGGLALADTIALWFFQTPLLLPHTLHLLLGPEPAGMQDLGLTCLLASSICSVAIVIWLCRSAAHGLRMLHKRQQPARIPAAAPGRALRSIAPQRAHWRL